MFTSIHLKSHEQKKYKIIHNGDQNVLTGLSKINIFIGPNNSGKSRFLRELFSDKNPEFTDSEIDLENVNHAVNAFEHQLKEYYNKKGIHQIHDVDLDLQTIQQDKFLRFDRYLYKEIYEVIVKISNVEIRGINHLPGGRTSNAMATRDISKMAEICLSRLSSIENFTPHDLERKNIYIPTLRGLRGIDFVNGPKSTQRGNDNFLYRTKNDYFKDFDLIEEKIYTGLSFYEDAKKLLLGGRAERNKIKSFENFLSNAFFEGKEVNIIPNINDDVVHVRIGDDEDYPIHKLGDGIQSIIILTYPIFFNQDKLLNVYFEEPDLFLHPGFQRIFLETLNRQEFKDFQFYFTTHSNHFLDMTLDFTSISVYKFSKTEKSEFEIENVKNDDNNILHELGVRNSSVFLTNCTIWVEGITDRIYLRKYLDLFQKDKSKNFKEDIHYSFVEYGGNNITHWSFLDSEDHEHKNINANYLCGKLFLITDKDGAGLIKSNEKDKKTIRQEKLEEKLGERYYCLKSREIENLLKENVLVTIIKHFEGSNSENIDFSKLNRESYMNKPLGKFIEIKCPQLKKKYASESGTIRNKVEFAKVAVSKINSFNDMSEEAQELSEKLYRFIESNN